MKQKRVLAGIVVAAVVACGCSLCTTHHVSSAERAASLKTVYALDGISPVVRSDRANDARNLMGSAHIVAHTSKDKKVLVLLERY